MSVSLPSGPLRVAVLSGGRSAERAVSLESGAGVAAALRRRGHEATLVDPGPDLAQRLAALGAQVCFNALHGTWGEDGCVQGLLELIGLPYTGSGPLASALAMDKERSKRLFLQASLPTPAFELWSGAALSDSPFGYPCVVKPAAEGSSVGISIVQRAQDLAPALAAAAACGDGRVLIEAFVRGREVTVGLLHGEVLGSTEIVPAQGFYDYEAKYNSDATRYHSPARLAPGLEAELCVLAQRAASVLGCGGAPRVDFLVDGDDRPWLLEVNTLPGMTGHSLLPMCARLRGLDYDELCEGILAGARLWVGQGRRP